MNHEHLWTGLQLCPPAPPLACPRHWGARTLLAALTLGGLSGCKPEPSSGVHTPVFHVQITLPPPDRQTHEGHILAIRAADVAAAKAEEEQQRHDDDEFMQMTGLGF